MLKVFRGLTTFAINSFTTKVKFYSDSQIYWEVLNYLQSQKTYRQITRLVYAGNKYTRGADSCMLVKVKNTICYVTFGLEADLSGNGFLHTITCCFIGNKSDLIQSLIDDMYDKKQTTKSCNWSVLVSDYGVWKTQVKYPKTSKDMVILNPELKQDIESDITKWLNSRDWYASKNINYRRGYLLHGPPGTGKTSIVKHIANKFNLNVYVLQSKDLTKGFMNLLTSINGRAIVLIEDIDSIFDKRKNKSADALNAITFGEFINTLDGISSISSILLIITTNKPDTIDEALMRPGRIDRVWEIKLACSNQIKDLFLRFYPDQEKAASIFVDSIPPYTKSMASIQNILLGSSSVEEVFEKLKDPKWS